MGELEFENKTRKKPARLIRDIIRELEKEYDEGAPLKEVLDVAESNGIDREVAEDIIEVMKWDGIIYSPDPVRISFV